QQQKMLIAMINKLIEAQDAPIRSETISDIVTRMTDYAQYHFWTKEKLILVPYYTQLPGQGAGRSQEDSRG
ncbi:MAG: hypothetical protein U9Q82_08340, partial [Chloroflexota bacterium]|nr:hypothetical protein [Chloroflexota bacterium]